MQEQEKQTAKGRDLYEWVQALVVLRSGGGG